MLLTRTKTTEARIEQMRRNSQKELDEFQALEVQGVTFSVEENNRRYKAWRRNRKAYRLGQAFNAAKRERHIAELIRERDARDAAEAAEKENAA